MSSSSEKDSNRSSTPSKSKNHYETLGLKQNCTEKQVKAAFINLSKVHHPDLNPSDPSQKDKFVKIYEAYEVLSRPDKRYMYDSDLRFQEKLQQENYHRDMRVRTNAPRYREWRDESIWHMREKMRQDYNNNENRPYYGIKGINRVSNYWIAGGAVLLMMLGTLLHYTALRYRFSHSHTFTVTQLDSKDERIARELFRVKRSAQRNGNEQQIEFFTNRFGWREEDDSHKKD